MMKQKEEPKAKKKGRRIVIEWQETVSELETLYKQEKQVNKRERLHALWLLRQGKSLKEISELLSIKYRRLQRWVVMYRQGGLPEVLQRMHGGKREYQQSYLTPKQEKAVKAKANLGDFHTGQEVVDWIKARWGIEYKPDSIYTLLARLKIKKKAPRRQAAQADEAKQTAWKKGGLVTS
jgi:transposase